jgi:eukaryotic-like serine/threonine-protein kinase
VKPTHQSLVRPRQKLGKYRIVRRLAQGGFAEVYKALDTIEGVPVALKIPYPEMLTPQSLEDFKKEVRLTARLDHPNILPIKNAEFIGDAFVVTTLLGKGHLRDVMDRALPVQTALAYFHQMLKAVAHAHQQQVIHCDVKPENLIVFPRNRLRLTDFGISRVAARTLSASGSGTVGYLAPEQALGRPSFRSDVFSLGLVLWEMLSGSLPQWPFKPPLPGAERIRRKVHPDLLAFLHKALQVDQYKRFSDAVDMLTAFDGLQARRRLLPPPPRKRRRATAGGTDWKAIRRRQFVREYKKELELDLACRRCGGPVSEAMQACPWCGAARRTSRDETRFPARCPRCRRGRKLDWRFCPWCHGPGFRAVSGRNYTDKRYAGRCAACRGDLMPFMRYCPWCRTKVRRAWRIDGAERCGACGWGVARDYWEVCPWCAKPLKARR